jgi:hypothetical protein
MRWSLKRLPLLWAMLMACVLATACVPSDVDTTKDGSVDVGSDAGNGEDGGNQFCTSDGSCRNPPGRCYQTQGTCTDGTCVYPAQANGTACAEGSPPGQCYASAGTCSAGICVFPPKASGPACDDGDACTMSDVCNGSGGCVGNAVKCQIPPSQCHQPTGTCSNGTCSYALKPTGTACNDGNACTTGDACNSSGTCGGTAMACSTPPSQCHQPTGTCSNGTCSYALKPSGTACNDGKACTTGDVCNSSGTCGGTAVASGTFCGGGGGDLCTVYRCNGTGSCLGTPKCRCDCDFSSGKCLYDNYPQCP